VQQKYVLSELDSGERIISERLAHVRSVSIGFWIGTGSRDETDAKAGLSHFLEHLLFKGTASYSAQRIAEIFDGLGVELCEGRSEHHLAHHVERDLQLVVRNPRVDDRVLA
jgi:predicted Zn-dependent peptidase